MLHQRAPVVAAYGMGTNSTALLIEYVRRGLRVDLILAADTGGEKPHTPEYAAMFSRWLVERNYPPVEFVRYTNRAGGVVTLEDDCLRKETLPSKAFGYSGCSLKWKIEPQEKFVNNWPLARAAWARGEKVVKVIGYDADEPERAERRRQKDEEDPKYTYAYPLIGWGWGREECEKAILSAGLPLPGKSSCYFCPSMTKPEIVQLAHEHPDLAIRAIDMEDIARDGRHGFATIKGLGRKFSWREFLAEYARQGAACSLNGPAEDTDCGCYDG